MTDDQLEGRKLTFFLRSSLDKSHRMFLGLPDSPENIYQGRANIRNNPTIIDMDN